MNASQLMNKDADATGSGALRYNYPSPPLTACSMSFPAPVCLQQEALSEQGYMQLDDGHWSIKTGTGIAQSQIHKTEGVREQIKDGLTTEEINGHSTRQSTVFMIRQFDKGIG